MAKIKNFICFNLASKGACFWTGVRGTGQNLNRNDVALSFGWQLAIGGLLANIPDVMAGRSMANGWSVNETLHGAAGSNTRDFARAYTLSCPL